METINIMIADDHEIIHNGIQDILKGNARFRITCHAFNGQEAVDIALRFKPDLIFMDISMPVLNGIEATRFIKMNLNEAKIIVLTQHEDKEYVVQAMKAGADGYILKNSKKHDFLEAMDAVFKGRRYLSSELTEQLISEHFTRTDDGNEPEKIHLTRREIEIIKKIAEDRSNHQIADELRISLRTVETHRRNLMQKLKVTTVVALLKYAATHKLIEL